MGDAMPIRAAAQALARKSAATRCNQTVTSFLGTAWAIRTEKPANYSPQPSRSAALDRAHAVARWT
jgi:hypothetical protein